MIIASEKRNQGQPRVKTEKTFFDLVEKEKANDRIMSKESLENLRNYIQLTLLPSDISWLADELLLLSHKGKQQQPYTIEELETRVAESVRQIAEGRCKDLDEALDELEAQFAEEDKKMAESV